MRNFDQERLDGQSRRDLEFEVGGTVFHVVPFVSPEALDAFQPTKRDEGQTIINVYDAWIESMVIEEDRPKWKKARAEADPPLELHTIETIVFWLVEVATGRPTERPSSSRPGPAAAKAGSAVTSSSRVQPA